MVQSHMEVQLYKSSSLPTLEKMNTSVRFKNIHKNVLAFHSLTMPKPFCLQTLKNPSNQNFRRKTSFGASQGGQSGVPTRTDIFIVLYMYFT